jgi:hypothetical protein
VPPIGSPDTSLWGWPDCLPVVVHLVTVFQAVDLFVGAVRELVVQVPLRWFVWARGDGTVSLMWLRKSALELRVDAIMEQVERAGGDHVWLVPPLEEYLRLAEDEGEGTEGFFFDVGAWSGTLAHSYLALGRVDDAYRTRPAAVGG